MKFKWGSCFILFIVIVITVFGIFEKRTYTNIAEDKSYLDELYVAQLPENICLEETENLSGKFTAGPSYYTGICTGRCGAYRRNKQATGQSGRCL